MLSILDFSFVFGSLFYVYFILFWLIGLSCGIERKNLLITGILCDCGSHVFGVLRQVGSGDTSEGSTTPNDHYCWMRPEDIDYDRPVTECHSCSELAAEMSAALAAASIVFKDNKAYSKKLVHGAGTLFKFSRDQRGRYSAGSAESATFYNSTGYWDEFVWGGAWMYFATGNNSYLKIATSPGIAKHAGAFWGGPDYGVLSWDNKLAGAQVILLRLFVKACMCNLILTNMSNLIFDILYSGSS